MNNEYKLSLAFCAVDETDLLNAAFSKTFFNEEIVECVFVLSQDCSSDCLLTVKKLCENPNCRYVFQDRKGIGNAIKTVFAEARGTHLIIWPADDGMDASVLKEMICISKQNPEKFVKISRWLNKSSFVNYSRVRKLVNRISQKLFALLYNSKLTDFTNPTQIAPVDVYRKIKWGGDDFSFVPEMVLKPLRLGCEFIEIPCTDTEKRKGKSHGNLFELIKYYFVVLKIRRKKTSSMVFE